MSNSELASPTRLPPLTFAEELLFLLTILLLPLLPDDGDVEGGV